MTLSREIIVSLDDGNELTLKQGDVIHSCALNKDGNIIDAYYKISDGNCLYIKSTLEANCFIEKDELSSDFKELIIRKTNDLSNARKTAVMAFTVIFIISFFISLAIMIVSKGNTKFHIVFIVVLGIISLLLLFVYEIS
ncbi:MAG: hypothetical protein J5802_12420 [Butyrivibrio sp.]|nr:hypothetical protein [Butyrivibrio sp.]